MQIAAINNKISFTSSKKTNKKEVEYESYKIKAQAPSWFEPAEEDVVEISKSQKTKELSKVEKALLMTQKATIEAQARLVANEATRLQNDSEDIGMRILDINFDTKEILASAIKKYDEVMEILLAASKDDFSTVYNQEEFGDWDKREFVIKNGVVTMFEYDFNNDVIREVVFDEDEIKISEYDEELKGWNVYEYDANTSNLTKFTKGKKESRSGAYSAYEQYVFVGDGELQTYDVKFKQSSNGAVKSKEHFDFTDGYIETYKNEYSKKADGTETVFEQFEFEKGQMVKYFEQLKKDSEDKYRANSIYKFNNQQGFLMCARGFEQDGEGAEANTLYICSDNEIKLAYLNYEFDLEDSEASADKIFRFDFDKIQKCAFNCKGSVSGVGKINKPRYESVVEF